MLIFTERNGENMGILSGLFHSRDVLYNCSASRPSIESETKEDTIEPGTETLSLTADPREDGLVKSRTGDSTNESTYADWYKSVYIPQDKETLQKMAVRTNAGGNKDA